MRLDLGGIKFAFRGAKREIVCDSSTRLGIGPTQIHKSHSV